MTSLGELVARAEDEIDSIARQFGGGAPELIDLRHRWIWETDEVEFSAIFSRYAPVHWRVPCRGFSGGSIITQLDSAGLLERCRAVYQRRRAAGRTNLDIVDRALRFIGVDFARECGDVTAIAAGVGDYRGFRIVETDLFEAPTANALRIEDLQRAQAMMRQMGGDYLAAQRYQREMETLMLAEMLQQRMQYLPPGATHGDRVGAEARGMKLLREWLRPAELEQFEKIGCFEVIGSHSGQRYRVANAGSFNIYLLDDRGQPKINYCFVPEDGLVRGDALLAQKVALETDEVAALMVANAAPVYLPGEFDLRPGAINRVFDIGRVRWQLPNDVGMWQVAGT